MPNKGCCDYFERAIKLHQQEQLNKTNFSAQKAQTQDGKKIEVAANITPTKPNRVSL